MRCEAIYLNIIVEIIFIITAEKHVIKIICTYVLRSKEGRPHNYY